MAIKTCTNSLEQERFVAKLNEMIKEFRLSIDQSVEAIALLMQMDPDDYARLEEDWIPPADILHRLCTLF